jgi:hypothetical protein
VPGGGSALDVGANGAELLERLDWFQRRIALDVAGIPPRPGVETVVADFNDFEAERRFDLVLCLQVLEHLERPRQFAHRLLRAGLTAIVEDLGMERLIAVYR